jgi:transcriptional regulator with XRE-family HTH domain
LAYAIRVMPRRRTPDPLALAVGQRIKQLREQAGLTIEGLAYESELGSKGHLSNLERGLAVPTVRTLEVLADRLGVRLLDLVTFPERDEHQALVDALRALPKGTVRRLLKDCRAPARRRTR